MGFLLTAQLRGFCLAFQTFPGRPQRGLPGTTPHIYKSIVWTFLPFVRSQLFMSVESQIPPARHPSSNRSFSNHTHANVHAHKHTQTLMLWDKHIEGRVHTHSHKYTHAHTHTYINPRENTLGHAPDPTHTRTLPTQCSTPQQQYVTNECCQPAKCLLVFLLLLWNPLLTSLLERFHYWLHARDHLESIL